MYIIDVDDEMKNQQNLWMIPEDESAIIMESENDEEETSYFEEYCEYKQNILFMKLCIFVA